MSLEAVVLFDATSDATLVAPPRQWAVPRESTVRSASRGPVSGVLSWSEHDPRGRVTLHAVADGTVRAYADTALLAPDSGAIVDVIELDGGCVVSCCRPRGWGCPRLHFLDFSSDDAGRTVRVSARTHLLPGDWTIGSIECDAADGRRVRVRYDTVSQKNMSETFTPPVATPSVTP